MLSEIFKGLIQLGNCKLTIPEKIYLEKYYYGMGKIKKI